MSAIAKLKLVASKRERFTSPTVARRQKLADKLEANGYAEYVSA